MLSAASPNFVHSLDASALTLTVDNCLDQGITDFAMVHDSYATHSPNMPKLNDELRSAFVSMYEDNDVLHDLYTNAVTALPKGVEVPTPPTKGSLNLREVLKSDYFFA
jgi:DNA-directed RNA polymerase